MKILHIYGIFAVLNNETVCRSEKYSVSFYRLFVV